VESCEKCNPEAEIPFDWVLRAFADAYVDYILPAPGLRPKFRALTGNSVDKETPER